MIDTTKLSQEEIAEVRAIYAPHHRFLKVCGKPRSVDSHLSYTICALFERLFGKELFSDFPKHYTTRIKAKGNE